MRDYLINFATNLDPNGIFLFSWPKWNSQTRSMLTFLDGFIPITILPDTFREVCHVPNSFPTQGLCIWGESGPHQFHDPVDAQVSDLNTFAAPAGGDFLDPSKFLGFTPAVTDRLHVHSYNLCDLAPPYCEIFWTGGLELEKSAIAGIMWTYRRQGASRTVSVG